MNWPPTPEELTAAGYVCQTPAWVQSVRQYWEKQLPSGNHLGFALKLTRPGSLVVTEFKRRSPVRIFQVTSLDQLADVEIGKHAPFFNGNPFPFLVP